MFSKNLSQLTYSDIEDLVNGRQEREGYHLDFKIGIGDPDKAKKELAKDISAFANTSGGYIILGVDKDYKIIGTDKVFQNKPIDEWINQILSSNVEPQVYYLDPKIIPIPNSEKVIVVIYVPESTKKPHIVNERNNYYIRINDSSKSANHNQIRDMFEFSKNRIDEFNNFLEVRNLIDPDDSNFGWNRNSNDLFSEIPEKTNHLTPKVLFSLIPKYPSEEKLKMSFDKFKIWLEINSKGYFPSPHTYLFYPSYRDSDIKIDGIVIKHTDDKRLSSYFEVLNNGYVEAGFSRNIAFLYKNKDQNSEIAIYLTQLISYEMLLLGFAKKFYELVKYYDEVLFQISFINVINLKLYGFNKKYSMIHYERENISNKHTLSFKLNFKFNPQTITNEEILEVAKQHSEKICRAFGLDKDYCFVEDELSASEMHNIL